ncbi:MAG: hypothetical protein ABFS28_05040 [Bacteroidota bacterium]
MDFDIGNLLYVVITLVAIIVGLLGKKKKPVDKGTGESGDEARPGFMENLEKVLRMGQEDPQPVDIQDYEEEIFTEEYEAAAEPTSGPAAETVAEPAFPSHSIMDDYDKIMGEFIEGGHDIFRTDGDNTDESLKVIDLDHEAGTDYFEIVKDFDAGTAVVYSAIINRLDY